jgi:FkbM family methyltransferase
MSSIRDTSLKSLIRSIPSAARETDLAVRGSLYASRDGVKFINESSPFRQIHEVPEYWMQDIRRDDRVLDLGANVGAFCIRAARQSRHVAAFEPLTAVLLNRNIRLNNARVRVFEAALGDGNPATVCWDTCRRHVRTLPLHELICCSGGCDFLKCDCEGAEWMIAPDDLAGIRRIEMELHQPPIGPKPNPGLLSFICDTYEFVIDRTPVWAPHGQMGVLHAWHKT